MTINRNRRSKLDIINRVLLCLILLTAVLLGLMVVTHLVASGEKTNKTAKENITQNDTQQEAQKQETEESTENLDQVVAEETQETEPATEIPFETEKIPNVEGLDNTVYGWGQGVQFDEANRPISAVQYQETYGKYQANFIGEQKENLYLTFDEGYEYGCTSAILDTLKEKDVKAVFFITEPYAKENPQLVQRMIDEGHVLGNHSVTHPADGMPSLSIAEQQEEVNGCHQYILDNFGYSMHLFRYPAGKFSEQSLAVVNNCNYKSVFWSFAYLDYDVNNQPDQQEALNKLVARIHPGAIYLLHAESETNTAILGSFIDQVRQQGYTLDLFQ